ncbi:hypothetical protein [Marisediminicola senii]|uniref:hypothetical protein n=1 Tax=Marisediminicola senii TaxID=2711233 RepID=UPI0013E9FCBC|nr:hypothetical protein [Marisediminicola senii]
MNTEEDNPYKLRFANRDASTADRKGADLQPFGNVSDRDLVTLADTLCRSLEFHSMLVASKVLQEIDSRNLASAVEDRRAQLLQVSNPNAPQSELRRVAAEQIQRFRGENFPVEPERVNEDPHDAANRWNGYIAF